MTKNFVDINKQST